MASMHAGTVDGVGARVVIARRSLPSGRAVVGGFLVALATVGTYGAYTAAASGPTHHFVVAARDLPPGTTVTAGDLATTTVDLPSDLAAGAFGSIAAVTGHITLAPLHKGELLQGSGVADAAKADPRYQLSLPLERTRALAGTVVAGELVDVLATYGTGNDARTIVVARSAQVVKVDDARKSTVGGSSDLVLVLALTSPDAVLAVTHASQAGAVTIVRTTGAASAGATPGADEYQPPTSAESVGGR